MSYESVIGLEVHLQLKTKSKLFCSCDNRGEEAPPNTTICPLCMGHPGVLPVLNREAVRFAVLAALSLNCDIPEKAKFDRKNYFYPDLPKGYQISMYDEPVGKSGFLDIDIPARGKERGQARIRINRVHLEEDAAKLIHEVDHPERVEGSRPENERGPSPAKAGSGRPASLADFNRAGTPLIEIVTEPDFRSPLEAKTFLQALRRIMRYLEVSDAEMEKGHLRCDANISLRQVVDDPSRDPWDGGLLHPKTEIKNINSFKAVERALEYEIMRQTKLWEAGNPPAMSTTRGWNDQRGTTEEQRMKEGGEDYRYFPEPDLPPLILKDLAEELRPYMPELPAARARRFIEEFGVSVADAAFLTEEKYLAQYVEKAIQELQVWIRAATDIEGTPQERFDDHKDKLMKLLSGWLTSKLFGLMEKHKIDIRVIKITPENFAEFLTLIFQNRISSAAGLAILEEMLLTGEDPSQIIEEKHLEQVSNEDELMVTIQSVIESSPGPVGDYKNGKENALQALMGSVIKLTRGKANPALVQKILKRTLKN